MKAASPALSHTAEKGAELAVTDLHPGMKIEVTAAHITLPDRPSWLSDDAQWPPQPDAVMYMIDGTPVGICDRCITRESDVQDLVTQHRGRRVIERGDVGWYCSANFKNDSLGKCRRHWNGRRYDSKGY